MFGLSPGYVSHPSAPALPILLLEAIPCGKAFGLSGCVCALSFTTPLCIDLCVGRCIQSKCSVFLIY